jgi:hypothetical protein
MFKDAGFATGDIYAHISKMVWNRTGITLKKGMIVMLDFTRTQAESTSFIPGASGNVFSNATIPTQPGIDQGYPLVIVESDSADDNTLMKVCLCSPNVECCVLNDDTSTTDVDEGDSLVVLVTEGTYMVQAWVTGAPANGEAPRRVGIAHEDAAADATTAARAVLVGATGAAVALASSVSHLRNVCWWGGVLGAGVSDT